ELEKLLKQQRQEEVERLLADLQRRCQHMLELQKAVRAGTVTLQGRIKDRKLSDADQRIAAADANDLAEREAEIIREADAAIKLLQSEGSAIAFPTAFKQVRKDMVTVKGRLEGVDVGVVTVKIEDDIIANLQRMIEALKEQRQQNQQQQQPPKPG